MDYRVKAALILVPLVFAFYAAANILTALISLVDDAQ